MPMPDLDARREILGIHLASPNRPRSSQIDAIVEALARKTENFSGARLRFLCDEAKRLAVRKVSYRSAVPPSMDDALEALEAELDNMAKGEGGNG